MHVDAATIRRLLLRAPEALRGAIEKHLTVLERAHKLALEARLLEADRANDRARAAEETAAALRCQLNTAMAELEVQRAAMTDAARLLAIACIPASNEQQAA